MNLHVTYEEIQMPDDGGMKLVQYIDGKPGHVSIIPSPRAMLPTAEAAARAAAWKRDRAEILARSAQTRDRQAKAAGLVQGGEQP